ncbi:MAG: hypothetical protein H6741_27360 [Alphaproteobacteria bacterium]|nr:hypothetical protein [Alphaproteobacteria bacterium]
MPPRPHGKLLPLAADGTLINPCGARHLAGIWRPTVDSVIETYRRRLGPELRSVWLRGSIPRGLGVPGVSDLDSLALVASGAPLEPPWLTEEARALTAAAPELEGVELWLLEEEPIFRDPDQRRLLALLSTQALCVWGDDLQDRLPRFRPGRDTVYACRGLRGYLAEGLEGLRSEPDLEERRAWLRWTAKMLVRAGLEICMRDEPVFTRDLWPCWEVFSRHHPARSAEMYAVMAWAVEPEAAPPDAAERLEVLGGWLVQQAERVWPGLP